MQQGQLQAAVGGMRVELFQGQADGIEGVRQLGGEYLGVEIAAGSNAVHGFCVQAPQGIRGAAQEQQADQRQHAEEDAAWRPGFSGHGHRPR